MAGTKYDARNLPQHIAEGNADRVVRERSAYKGPDPAFPIFLRFVIVDVISDPQTLDSAKLAHYEHDLGVANVQYAAVAPQNSIIARRVLGGDSGASEKTMVLYPFFPPHLAFPAKPGEHVWGMFEHPDAKVNDIGYWFCRISQPNFVEDQNYTHADRQFDQSFTPGLSDIFDGKDDPKYEFHNGAVDTDNAGGGRYVHGDTASMFGDDHVYEKLLTDSDAAKLAQYEAVPRYRKRPQDVKLEGSNNTLIVLGTDRTGPISDYDNDPSSGRVPKPTAEDTVGPGAGSIDIVVGRGQTATTAGKVETNSLGNRELGKTRKDLTEKEGDVDWVNDRSRVLLSQKTKPDTNLDIANIVLAHAKSPSIEDGDGEGCVVVKTDKVRIIARHDVMVLVTGATGTDNSGNVQDPGHDGTVVDPTQCASIIVRSNGDIVFTPAAKGVVKIGGDDANLAVFCTPAPNASDASGQVIGAPITNSFGGVNGAGGASGQWASKVLIK